MNILNTCNAAKKSIPFMECRDWLQLLKVKQRVAIVIWNIQIPSAPDDTLIAMYYFSIIS